MSPFSHPLGLLAGERPHITLLALVLPYSGNPTGRFDTAFSLGIIPKINAPFFSLFGVAGRGKALPKMAGIGHSIHRDLTGTLNTIF